MQSVGVSVGLPTEMLLALKLVKQPIARLGQACPNGESVEPVPVLPACIELREGFVVTARFLLVAWVLVLAFSLANKFTTDTPGASKCQSQ